MTLFSHLLSICNFPLIRRIHSFILGFSITSLQVLYYSETLPDYSTDTVSEFHAEAKRGIDTFSPSFGKKLNFSLFYTFPLIFVQFTFEFCLNYVFLHPPI